MERALLNPTGLRFFSRVLFAVPLLVPAFGPRAARAQTLDEPELTEPAESSYETSFAPIPRPRKPTPITVVLDPADTWKPSQSLALSARGAYFDLIVVKPGQPVTVYLPPGVKPDEVAVVNADGTGNYDTGSQTGTLIVSRPSVPVDGGE